MDGRVCCTKTKYSVGFGLGLGLGVSGEAASDSGLYKAGSCLVACLGRGQVSQENACWGGKGRASDGQEANVQRGKTGSSHEVKVMRPSHREASLPRVANGTPGLELPSTPGSIQVPCTCAVPGVGPIRSLGSSFRGTWLGYYGIIVILSPLIHWLDLRHQRWTCAP